MSAARHRLAQFLACATFALVLAGGLVTSTGSGLSVPDWPLSHGQLFPPMVGGVLYEHGHRLIAGSVALLTAALAIWLQLGEPRRWVRRLGWVALGTVLGQALLGGLTVLFLLPPAISVGHAGMAMIFLSLVSSLALFTSPDWTAPAQPEAARRAKDRHAPLGLAVAATAVLYAQVLFGALVHHTGSGLAIPTFPLAFGRLVPPLVSFEVQVSFVHRLGAVAASAIAVALAARVLARHRDEPRLARPALLLLALLAAQILLGGYAVWTANAAPAATAHVAAGALTVVVALRVCLESWRLRALAPPRVVSGSPLAAQAAQAEKPLHVMSARSRRSRAVAGMARTGS